MSKEKKVKKGCTEFIPNSERGESGVEQKLYGLIEKDGKENEFK